MSGEEPTQDGLRRAVLIVALLNLAYFGVEFAVALAIGSVSLFADSIDFLEDAAINLLILFGLAWSATQTQPARQGACRDHPRAGDRNALDGRAEALGSDGACALAVDAHRRRCAPR